MDANVSQEWGKLGEKLIMKAFATIFAELMVTMITRFSKAVDNWKTIMEQ